MTVKEVMDRLSRFDQDMNVYVLALDGTTQIAKVVEQFPHLNAPPGVTIPDDVWILPFIETDEML